jgi:pyrimidine oxygenase
VELGVFLPISNNGWIVSKTAPQYKPTFELNSRITRAAEALGFEFVLSMCRWRGYGGETEHWDHNLESLTLMAGLAAVTDTIELYATVHPTAINPYVAAKMVATIDDISGGRAGLNIASGWDKFELDSFSAWPGDEHYNDRYELAEEWLRVATALWETGRCSFDGRYFRIQDAISLPTPQRPIPIVNAGMSPRGLEFSATFADTSFVSAREEDIARRFSTSLREKREEVGNPAPVKMAAAFTVVAADTDEEAHATVARIRGGADTTAIDEMLRRTSGAGASPTDAAEGAKHAFHMPLLIGSPTSIAGEMHRFAEAGVDSFLLTFPDFVEGIGYFGKNVLPLLKR